MRRLLFSWALPLIIVLIFCSTASASSVICTKCGRTIDNGRYIQAGDLYYHPEHFVCAWCGKPIGANQYHVREGNVCDRECYEKQFAPKCAWCSEPILDVFTTSQGKSYHDKCYTENIALRCRLCDEIIDGKYITTFRGGAWHSRHKGTVPECDFCGALIDTHRSDRYVRYTDNRYLCHPCGLTAVTSLDSVRSLAENVASILSGMSMLTTTRNLNFILVGKNEMDTQGEHMGQNRRGYTDYRQYSQLFGLFKERQLKVYILYGMPKVECIEVLSHELMHAWLFLQGRTKTAPQLCEGSCNFASLLVLRRFPGAESDYIRDRMLKDTDPVYGEGLRKVKKWVDEKGTAAWLDYITKHDKNPW